MMTISTVAVAKEATPSVVPIEHWQLKNGINVYLVSMREIPVVDIGVVFNAGSALDGEHSGLATLTNAMLDEGTQSRNADQIAQAFEDVGAQFSSRVELDYAALTLRTMSDKTFLEPAITAFADVINHPVFPDEDFNRLKDQILRSLQEQEQQPDTVVEKAFFAAVFDDDPYAKPSLGTIESVKPLSKEMVEQFYKKHYNAANVHIVLVGDIDRKNAEKVATSILGNLPNGTRVNLSQSTKDAFKPTVKNIRFPSEQTHILIGQRGIERLSPDYFPLIVGNQILGGGILTSRLYKEVREKEGLAYSVYSYFEPLKRPGPFMMGMQTRNEKAAKAIKIAQETLANYVSTGPTEEELEDVKSNIIKGFPLRLASNKAILLNMMNMSTYGLPLNYLDTYRDNIKAVSVESIRSAFSRHLDPKHLVTITVGNSDF